MKWNFKFSMLDLVTVVCYLVFVCLLALGMTGQFSRTSVILTLVVAVLAVGLLWKNLEEKKIPWKIFLLVPAVVLGFAFLRGFFAGDTYEYWLPAGWQTAVTGWIPDYMKGYYYAGMPLPSLFFAATFSLFGRHNEFLALWVPLFFSSATLWLMYQWGKERGLEKYYLYFLVTLFVTNQLFAELGWGLLQEAPVLFFATAVFYYLDRLLEKYTFFDLLLFSASLTLAAVSKISGLFLLPLLVYAFFKLKDQRRVLAYSFVLLLPLLVWLVRNYLIFGNPVFPALASWFSSPDSMVLHAYQSFQAEDIKYFSFLNRITYVLPQLLSAIPFILLSFYGFYKSKRWFYAGLVLAFALLKEYYLFTSTQSATRYYYFLLGLLAVYAVLGLAKLQSRLARIGLLLLATLGLLITPIIDSTSIFISSWEHRFSFLRTVVAFVSDYKYLFFLLLIPAYVLLVKKGKSDEVPASPEKDKVFLVMLYGLFILQLYFVVNKSWLATWPFILAALLSLFFMRKYSARLLPTALVFVSVVTVSVSWGMGAVYALRQPAWHYPADFVYQYSREARTLLDERIPFQDRKNFYILITSQPDYFNWLTDYQAISFPEFIFFKLIPEYHSDLTSSEFQQLLEKKKVKYIVSNNTSYDYSSTASENLKIFLNKIKISDKFVPVGRGEGFEVFQVY
jgi:hypothetical protein